MGQASKLKKLRKYTRQNFDRIQDGVLKDFQKNFKVEDYLRPKPRLIPQWFWNFILDWIIRK
jgi:hypothetical protein